MRIFAMLLAYVAAIAAAPAAADSGSFEGAQIVPDGNLGDVRGGFLLPNGMDIGLGITVDTLVDGRLALSTVMTVDNAANLSIYTGGNMRRQTTTTEFRVPGPNSPTLFRITQDESPSLDGGGKQPIAISPNGAPVATPLGTVQLSQSDTQSTVVFAGEGLELRHMIGAVTGALVANTANNRVIDTMVTVNLDIRHSAIPVGAMMLGLDTLLAGAAARGAF